MAIDQAILQIFNYLNTTAYIWTQVTECYQCPLLLKAKIDPNKHARIEVNTNYGLESGISTSSDPTIICRNTYNMYDKGKYILNLNMSGGAIACPQLHTETAGHYTFWPLLVAGLVYLAIATAFYLGRRTFNRLNESRTVNITTGVEADAQNSQQQAGADSRRRRRVQAVDCFRGITILMMIFANYGAGDYGFIDHAKWDGIHLADFIFPWFIFIMGTTMAISFKSLIVKQNKSPLKVFWKIIKRSVILFTIGFMLGSSGADDLSSVRIPGVLQRFGASYLVVAMAHASSLYLHRGQIPGPASLIKFHLMDIIPYYLDWLTALVMGSLYFYLTFFWNYDPNCPPGYVEPGGLYKNASHPKCTGGAAGYIDRKLLTRDHLFGGFAGKEIYDPDDNYKIIHDPEGILGTTNSIILTFVGLQMGKILVSFEEPKQRLIRWSFWFLMLTIATVALAFPGFVPINKNLWSFSFITLTGAAAVMVLTVLYVLIDVTNFWSGGQPFHYPGMNSILLYIGHSMTGGMFPFALKFKNPDHPQLLASCLVGVSMWFIISVVLARKQIFLTI